MLYRNSLAILASSRIFSCVGGEMLENHPLPAMPMPWDELVQDGKPFGRRIESNFYPFVATLYKEKDGRYFVLKVDDRSLIDFEASWTDYAGVLSLMLKKPVYLRSLPVIHDFEDAT